VDDVRTVLAQKNFADAEAKLDGYRSERGLTPEYLEAYSWLARAALEQRHYEQAEHHATPTKFMVLAQLKTRELDADAHLPIAPGAALDVQSQVLAARGQTLAALNLLRTALRNYGNTSIQERLQKNLNLLSFQGKVAPALKVNESMGAKLPSSEQLEGYPVLLFFWAHWCGDCKAAAPSIARLRSEFAPKGLKVIGPTRLYGYTAQTAQASAANELQHIDVVRHRFYSALLDIPVPVSKYNFDVYGASTVPTLVLLDWN
jgi:thiol-disulfide isomerase/thioredoxin